MAFFEANRENHEKVVELAKQPDAAAWQQLTASVHSDGIVTDEEVLLRQLQSPFSFDELLRTPRLNAFDDMTSRGMSVDRVKEPADVDAVHAAGRLRYGAGENPSDRRKYIGALEISAGQARGLVTGDGKPAAGVYDTADADNKAHADVCAYRLSEGAGRSIRSKMFEAFKKVHFP
jgi:aryl carrier-like protein